MSSRGWLDVVAHASLMSRRSSTRRSRRSARRRRGRSRGEGVEQEVLERGLLAEQPASACQAAEQVERQREYLERHEQGQQVAGGREEHHADDGEQEQRVDLGRSSYAPSARRPRCRAGHGARRANAERTPRRRSAKSNQRRAKTQDEAPEEHARAVDGDAPFGRDAAPRPRRVVASQVDLDRRRRPNGRRVRSTPHDRNEHLDGVAAIARRRPRRACRGRPPRRRPAADRSSAYSMVGLTNSVRRRSLVDPSHRHRAAGYDGVRAVVHADVLDRIGVDSGLITSSSGIGKKPNSTRPASAGRAARPHAVEVLDRLGG